MVRGVKKRKAQVVLTPLGKLTLVVAKLFPRLCERLTLKFIAKEG